MVKLLLKKMFLVGFATTFKHAPLYTLRRSSIRMPFPYQTKEVVNRMLQALNERGELIILSTLRQREINQLRKHLFYCPQCKEQVIIRAGSRVIPHFAHLPESLCTIDHGGESDYHKRAKLILYEWFQSYNFSKVYLELFLPTINQRPDILIKTNDKMIAVEFQSASISPELLRQRNEGYAKANIIPFWIIGENQLKALGKNHSFQINAFMHQLIQSYRPNEPSKLVYFCPHKAKFTVLNDLHFYRQTKAYARPETFYLDNIHFKQLFLPYPFPRSSLYRHWYEEKRRFRLAAHRVTGKELHFRQWLYQKQVHVEQLPSLIHLPIASQYKMKTPIWHWQARLVLDLLHPLKISSAINISQCKAYIKDDINPYYQNDMTEIIEQYFDHLVLAQVFVKRGEEEWEKIRHFRFHRYIEASLKADKILMTYLSKKEQFN